MPWKEVTPMSQRKEFVMLTITEEANMATLCRRFGISRKTGYKWFKRYQEKGDDGLEDQSRKPQNSPLHTSKVVEDRILAVRDKHPTWGGRKIAARLITLGMKTVPAASTITAILNRHGKIDPQESSKHKAFKRFEALHPNDLWQMDFKGHFGIRKGRCHPLTLLDDHSRYSLAVRACENEQGETVKNELIRIFQCYGLPMSILCDNGSPWGGEEEYPYSRLTAWLIRLGIQVIHSRPCHPQTVGKDERFHQTLKKEVIQYLCNPDLKECQRAFDQWREVYNCERPHESLGMQLPASRYRISERVYSEKLPPIEYGPGDEVRKVQDGGFIFFKGGEYRVGGAFKGEHVALRPKGLDGIWEIFFCNQKIFELNLKISH